MRGPPLAPARPRGPRRGLSVVGIVFLVMLAAAGAVYLFRLAAQAGRSSHWFVHAQQAQNLARAGLVTARTLLREVNRPAAPGLPAGATASLTAVRQALATGAIGSARIPLFDSAQAGSLPAGMASVLETLDGLSPAVRIELALVEAEGLEAIPGLPQDSGERRGRVQLVARGSVTPVGQGRIERTMVMELGFKRVSILVPLLSRFVLFAAEQEGTSPNFVALTADPDTGDARRGGGPIPLVVRAGASAPLVAPGSATLDRSQVTARFPEPDFLDRQGWVYLGGSSPWVLKLAHGFGEEGETVLLPGDKRRVAYAGAGGDDGFRGRFSAGAPQVAPSCQFTFDGADDGLYYAFHGYAGGYQKLAVDRSLIPQLGPGAEKPDLGEPQASALRLFGTPEAVSPTLVFGPVDRGFLRRASVRVSMGPAGECPRTGSVPLAMLRLEEHSPGVAQVLTDAFQGADGYDQFSTAAVVEPFAQSLNVVLDARGQGAYAPNGLLAPGATPAAGAPAGNFVSTRVASLAGLPAAAGELPSEALQALRNGDLQAPELFTGALRDGLATVHRALASRLTYQVEPAVVASLLIEGGKLRVPGVVLVAGPLTLPAVTEVVEGGVLVAEGAIEVTGEVRRGAGREPLALVSLKGDIRLAPAAGRVEALLVALDGRIRLPTGATVIEGGMAGRWLDLDTLRGSPASRVVSYALDMDRSHAPARDASYRTYFGGQASAAVAGGALAP